MRFVILGGVAAMVLSAAPALAKPPSPAQLAEAVLTPEDLGDGYSENSNRPRAALDKDSAHTKACRSAMSGLKPLLRSKAAAWIDKQGKPSGVWQFALGATPAGLASWQAAGKAMVRDCAGVDKSTKKRKEGIKRLSVGRVGTWVYAIRYSDHPQEFARPIHAQDVVLMRVGQAVTLVVSDGYFGTFDPVLSRRAARLAAAKLKEAQG
ncbi:hypothetical protein [Nonomuraea endophytica]|uniref:PknH-like extracellular domain-containing protein n=1 Tax=Nonomuraea endophytica TaxID=714136 RepID=A0A7W8EEV8_9ACTN|nr:hypothetical protein [Nonomuraea endophytica]MBB5076989.1 hypothetical protein [Nonomuraea endophytica]